MREEINDITDLLNEELLGDTGPIRVIVTGENEFNQSGNAIFNQ